MRKAKEDSVVPLARLQKLLQITEMLKKGRWSIPQLAAKYDTSQPTMYRYIQVLESADLCIEKDFQDCYYIITPENNTPGNDLTNAEWKFIRRLVQAAQRTPLRDSIIGKLVTKADLKKTPAVTLQAHLGDFIDQLERGMTTRHQVLLKGYHSANSNKVSDRLVEPIHFGDNYQTIVAFDTHDKKCKHFKLDRIDDVEVKRTRFKHEKHHEKMATDIFGYTGKTIGTISLKLSLPSRLALREEFPLASPYIKEEQDHYIFTCPVSNYERITRFVLGFMTEVTILGPTEFREYVLKQIKGNVL